MTHSRLLTPWSCSFIFCVFTGVALAQCTATNVAPVPSSRGVNPVQLTLQWSAPAGECPAVDQYRVYLRKGSQPASEADFLGETTGQSLQVPGSLDHEETYWWRVDAVSDEMVSPGQATSFITNPSNQPMVIHYYWESRDLDDTSTVKTLAVEVIGPENPDGPLPGIGIYNLITDFDEGAMGFQSLGPAPSQRGPRLSISPQPSGDTSAQVAFFGLYGGSQAPTVLEGFVADLRFTLPEPLDPPSLPVELRDNLSGGEAVLSWRHGQPIPHTFAGTTFIPMPRAARLLEPEDGATVTAMPTLRFRRTAFNRTWEIYLWPLGDSRPEMPTFSIDSSNMLEFSRTVTEQLAKGERYQWQVVSRNDTGSRDSAIRQFTVLSDVTPTASPSPTVSLTPTASPTASVTPTVSPSPSPSPKNAATRETIIALLLWETDDPMGATDLNGDQVTDTADVVLAEG